MTPPALGSAIGVGVVGTALGGLVLLVTGVPPATGLLLALVVPALTALGLALVRPGQRGAWLRAAAGMALGSVLCLAVLVGLIAGLAHLLSDPA